jgi:hypothetical protein
MALKYKNGTEAKEGDKVVGFDHCNRPCAGAAVKGIPSQGQDELVFKNDAHGAVQSSLSLTQFLRSDEAEKFLKSIAPAATQPAASTAK